jgi:hypothetical protein
MVKKSGGSARGRGRGGYRGGRGSNRGSKQGREYHLDAWERPQSAVDDVTTNEDEDNSGDEGESRLGSSIEPILSKILVVVGR